MQAVSTCPQKDRRLGWLKAAGQVIVGLVQVSELQSKLQSAEEARWRLEKLEASLRSQLESKESASKVCSSLADQQVSSWHCMSGFYNASQEGLQSLCNSLI